MSVEKEDDPYGPRVKKTCTECPPSIRPHWSATHYSIPIPTVTKHGVTKDADYWRERGYNVGLKVNEEEVRVEPSANGRNRGYRRRAPSYGALMAAAPVADERRPVGHSNLAVEAAEAQALLTAEDEKKIRQYLKSMRGLKRGE